MWVIGDHINLFLNANERDDQEIDRACPDLANGFTPIADKYFEANNIPFDNFEITTNKQFLDKFNSVGINIRSLANTKNFAKLQVFLENLCFSPSVIAINETFLRDNNFGPHYDLKNYEFLSNCRKKHRGGGVGIYVHESVNFEIREDLTIMEDKIFVSLFIEIKGADRNFIHGTIYRSPNSDNDANNIFQEYLKKCLAKLKKSKKACFIQGDLNFNLIEVSDKYTESFTDIMFDNSFYPHINIPTRITATSATCIDHIYMVKCL